MVCPGGGADGIGAEGVGVGGIADNGGDEVGILVGAT
jgi:hypothetical protein